MDSDLWGGLILLGLLAFILWVACGGRCPQALLDLLGTPDDTPSDQQSSDRSRE